MQAALHGIRQVLERSLASLAMIERNRRSEPGPGEQSVARGRFFEQPVHIRAQHLSVRRDCPVRSSVLEAMGQEHVQAARAKGMRARDVLSWHVLRNALIPLVTVGGIQLAYLLSAVVVIEVAFRWPGPGQPAPVTYPRSPR